MKYKLLALDIDGTLVNSKSELDYITIKSIQECIKKGVKVVLASGREYNAIKENVDKLNLVGEQVTLNGAVIVNESGIVVKSKLMPSKLYTEILTKLRNKDLGYITFDEKNSYADIKREEFDDLIKRNICAIHYIDDCLKIKTPTKIVGICYSDEQKHELDKIIEPYNVNIMKTWPNYYEISSKEVSKETGIKYISEINNIKKEEIIAIGDSENDIEMIKYAGLGVAMGNAYSHIKDISDYITDTNDNFGVSKVIEKFILQ